MEVVAVAVAAVAVVGGTQVVAENKTIINSDEFLTQIKRAAWLGLPAPADFICLFVEKGYFEIGIGTFSKQIFAQK